MTFTKFKDDYIKMAAGIDKDLALPSQPTDWGDLDDILHLTRTQLCGLSPAELCQMAFVLSQYAMFLQLRANKCEAFISYAEYRQKQMDAQQDCASLARQLEKARLTRTQVAFLSRRVEFMATSLQAISRTQS